MLLHVEHISWYVCCQTGLVYYLLVDALCQPEQLTLQVLRIARLQSRIDAIGECNECATVQTLLAEQAIQHGVHAVQEVGVESLRATWDALRLLPRRMLGRRNELLDLDVIFLHVRHALVHEIVEVDLVAEDHARRVLHQLGNQPSCSIAHP